MENDEQSTQSPEPITPSNEPPVRVNGQPINRDNVRPIQPSTPRVDIPENNIQTAEATTSQGTTESSQEAATPQGPTTPQEAATYSPTSSTRSTKSSKNKKHREKSKDKKSKDKKHREKTKDKKSKVTQRARSNARRKIKEYNIPDYRSMTEEERSQVRQELFTKIKILRDEYPEYEIETPSETTSCRDLHLYHESCMDEILAHEAVRDYTQYLILGWVAIELACQAIGVDATGFAKIQLSNLYRYRRSLIEMGRRKKHSGGSGGTQWSPETTLLVQSLISLAVMVGINYASEKYLGGGGEELKKQVHKELMNNVSGSGEGSQESSGDSGILSGLLKGGGVQSLLQNFLGGSSGGSGNSQQRASQQTVYDE